MYRENQKTFWLSFYIFLTFIILWRFISITKIGFSNDEDYWYEAGVPILLWQVILALVVGIGFGIAEKKFNWGKSQRINWIIFFSIWVFTAILWAVQPAAESYMNPAPRLPNQEMYPYSDALQYDMSSQFMLIGQGLNNQKAEGIPLYSIFLAFVHVVSGQSYQDNMAVQAAVLAILPATIYIIANLLHTRVSGVVIAILIALRGVNSIEAASIISTASPKQMLTDFPAALSISIIILFFLFWFHKQRKPFLIWAGASIGFAFLLRSHTIALIGLMPLLILLPAPIQTQRWRLILLCLLGFIIVITPWGIRNTIYGDDGLATYFRKSNLVVEERFPETQDEWTDSTPRTWNEAEEDSEQRKSDKKEQTSLRDIFAVTNIISNHFIHNIITSTLVLPISPSFSPLDETLKSQYLYWRPFWDGSLSLRSFIFLLISLGILSSGLGVTFQKTGFVGIIPFLGFLLYQLVNAIGRTSGGRYIVPVDWILILYVAIGLVELIFILIKNRFSSTLQVESAQSSFSFADNLPRTMVFVFLLAIFLPLSEMIFPLHHQHPYEEKKQIPESPLFSNALTSTVYTEEQILTFLQNERKAVLLVGRVLYPRYFFTREAIQSPEDAFFRLKYPRLEFFLIGPNNKQIVILASQTPLNLQNISDVFVLGCDQEDDSTEFIDTISIIPYQPQQEVLMRQPAPPLECPLPKMVCDNNGNCQ